MELFQSGVRKMALTPEQAQQMLLELAEHFNEPVMPVSKYCSSLKTWAIAIQESQQNADNRIIGHGHTYHMHLNAIVRDIMKSNLLYRLIYDGQPLRVRPCPTHKGRWSGCHAEPCPDGCSDGGNVTGWLPND